jgi:hypothetical protein
MAKKQIFNYTFTPGAGGYGSIDVDTRIPLKRLLLITNVTDGVIIYNFADPTKGATQSYSTATDKTSFLLQYDTSAMSAGDELQIFIDADAQEIDFKDSFYDPVNKLRISNPENLIDTDFEYGLQSSKWETLELVNNYPSYHSTTGDSSLTGITAVTSQAGSDQITVTFADPHRLTVGTPIDVRGLASVTAEGNFLITSVPSSTTFVYKAKSTQSVTQSLFGSYTAIIAGRFFNGSALEYSEADGIVSDNASQSKLTVNTSQVHGFNDGTEIYLLNTLGVRESAITNTTTDAAADGDYYVEHRDSSTTDKLSSLNTQLNETKGVRGTHYLKFVPSASTMNLTNNTITWTGHNLLTDDCVYYLAPYGEDEIVGLNRFDIYYVEKVDANTIKLKDTSDAVIDLTGYGTSVTGRHQLGIAYELAGVRSASSSYNIFWETIAYANGGSGSGRDLTSSVGTYGVSGSTRPQHLLFCVRGTNDIGTNSQGVRYWWGEGYNGNFHFPITAATSSTDAMYRYFPFEVEEKFLNQRYAAWGSETGYWSSGDFSTSGNADYEFKTLYTDGFNYSGSYDLSFSPAKAYYVIPLVKDSEGNTVYVANHGASTGDEITITTSGNFYSSTGTAGWNSSMHGLTDHDASAVTVSKVDDNRLALQGKSFYSLTGTISALSITAEKTNRDTFYYADHGLSTGATTSITATNGGAVPTVLSGAIAYTTATDHLPFMHKIAKDAIEAWQTSNSSKFENFTVGNSPIRMRASGSSGNSNFNYLDARHYARLGTNNTVQALARAFGDVPDDTLIQTMSNSYHSDYLGFDMYKNLNTNGASVPYGLISSAADKVAAYQSTSVSYRNGNLYRHNATSSTVLLEADNQTRNGFKYTAGVLYQAPSAGTHSGAIVGQIVLWKDAWATNTSNTPTGNSTVRSYSNRGYIYTGTPTYSACHYMGYFQMQVPNNATWSGTDATNLINAIIDAFDTNFDYPTLTSGDTVGVTVVDNNRFKIFDTTTSVPFDLTNSGTADLTFGSITPAGTSYGALDGTYPIHDSPSTTSYRLQLPFSAPTRVVTFASAAANTSDDTVTANNHGLITGMPFVYANTGGTKITELTANTTYYAIVVNEDLLQFATSSSNATAGSAINFTGAGTGNHTMTINSVTGMTPQTGVITTTANSAIITGDEESLFKRYWKTGDEIIIKNTTTSPATLVESEVKIIPTDGKIELASPLSFTSNTSSVFRKTELYVRPNGLFQHKPFDGGVAIQTGTSPNSSIARQTRKYFRYQSGKGIQTSYAMNFNPPVQLESLNGSGNTATATTRYPHRLTVNNSIEIVGSEDANFNGTFTVANVANEFTFTYDAGATLSANPNGFPDVYINSYTDSHVRGGMFDEQNGFFYEYDGQDIYCVRRSSTQQLSGTFAVINRSHVVTGTNTVVNRQLTAGDMIVIRGQSYKVTHVSGATTINIAPSYRGVTGTGVIITKTIDTKVKQSNWSVDPCDGTGESGFNLDLKKIQMAYMDYAWYGAGKIRFGWKGNDGKVIYTHEFIHNNILKESYFRSGNLPARYEVGTGTAPAYYPALFHWGTSVIMDGTFDDDKAYLFTSNSNTLTFSNGLLVTANTSDNSFLNYIYNFSTRTRDYYVNIPFATSDAAKLVTGTPMFTAGGELTGQIIDSTYYRKISGQTRIIARIYILSASSTPNSNLYPSVNSGTTVSFGASSAGTTDVDLGTALIPLISIRLAPSVDGGLSGTLGQRDIINRMQLKLNTVGVVLTHDCEVSMILNSDLSTTAFENVQSPSLCQTIKHEIGQEIFGGSNLFQFRASGGAEDSAGQNTTNTSNFTLGEVIDLGNSILGGDGVYPNGPDLLTIAVKVLNSSGVSAANQFQASARISWAESQA